MKRLVAAAALLAMAATANLQAADKVELLNASYDVSRELFVKINPAFQAACARTSRWASWSATSRSSLT